MAEKEFKYIGKSLPIDDAAAKAAGSMVYTSDRQLHGMLHMKIVHSPHPHARVKNVDAAAALAVPGVVRVYSHLNTPETRYNSQVWYMNQKPAAEDERLFTDVVRFVGDRVAAVVARDRATAARAADMLVVDYEPRPAIFDPEQALAAGAVSIHPQAAPLCAHNIETGDTDAAFATADIIVEDRIETPKVHHGALENFCCLAEPDPRGKITVYSPCQCVFNIRLVVAKALGLRLNRVRVVKTPVGGSFGGRFEAIIEPLCAFAARDIGRPVKISFDRAESIVASRTRTRTIGIVKTGVSRDGRILARDIRAVIDAGAYATNSGILSMALGKKLFRLYRIAHQRYRSQVVYTNTPVPGTFRGYGSPQGHAMTEINLDHVARKLGMDPVALRLKNLVHPGDLDPSGGTPLGDARIIDCVRKGAAEFGWTAKRNRPRQSGRLQRGVGMAAVTHVNGYFGAFHEFSAMTLRLLTDGSLILIAGLHEIGVGTITMMKQIVAETLSIDPGQIEVPEADSDTAPLDSGSQASRVTHVCGQCARKVARSLKALFTAESAKIFNCAPEDISMEDEIVWDCNRPGEKMAYGQMAALIQSQNSREVIVTDHFQASDNPAAFGTNFAEVEVDTRTGIVRVVAVVAVHDVGRAINPGSVHSQIHGGILMGMGLALTEDIAIDPKTGRARGNSLLDYGIANAPAMPAIRTFLIEKGGDSGLFGAKSIAEIATVPIAPAVVNAVNHALGSNLTTLPLTPEKILTCVQGLGSKTGF